MLSKISHFTILIFYTILFFFSTKLYSQENLIIKNIGIEIEAPGFYLMDDTSKAILENLSKEIYKFHNPNDPTPEVAVNEKGQGILFHKLSNLKLPHENKEIAIQELDTAIAKGVSGLQIESKRTKSGNINGKNYFSLSYSLRWGKEEDIQLVMFFIEFDDFLLRVDFTHFTYNEALPIMKSIKSNTSSSSIEFQNELKQMIENKDYETALLRLNKEIKDNPKKIDLYEKRLSINSYLGNTAAIQSDIKILNNLDPQNPIPKLVEGFIEYEKGEYENAILTLNEALALYSNRYDSYDGKLLSRALLALGDSYRALNLYDKALDSYKTVIGKETNDDVIGTAYFKIGSVYQIQDQPQSAINNYDKALKLLPEKSSALKSKVYFNRSSCHNMVSNSSLAIRDANNALLNDPSNYEAYLNLAISHFLSSNNREALNNATKFIDSKPIDSTKIGTAYSIKGAALLLMDNFQEGCINLKKAEEFKITIPPGLKAVCD